MPWPSTGMRLRIRDWRRSRRVAKPCLNSAASRLLGSPRAIRRQAATGQVSYNERMVMVHHLNNSRSQRVLWLLEELGVPYEVKRYERDAKTMLAPPALLQVHPLGKSPVIVDGAVTVAESGAIIEYLVDKYGGGRLIPPVGSAQRLRYSYWLHYAEGSAMPPLLMKLIFDRVAANPAPWPISAIARRIAATVQSSFIGPNLRSEEHTSVLQC